MSLPRDGHGSFIVNLREEVYHGVYSFVNNNLGTRTAFPILGMVQAYCGGRPSGVARNCALKMALNVAFCTLDRLIWRMWAVPSASRARDVRP